MIDYVRDEVENGYQFLNLAQPAALWMGWQLQREWGVYLDLPVCSTPKHHFLL